MPFGLGYALSWSGVAVSLPADTGSTELARIRLVRTPLRGTPSLATLNVHDTRAKGTTGHMA